MLLNLIRLITFYKPDDSSGIGGDFMSSALSELGEFDSGEATDLDTKDGADIDSDGDGVEDIDDDKKDDDIGEDEPDDDKPIRDIKTSDDEDKKDDDKPDSDKKEEEKKTDDKPVEIEAKDLTPRALKESYPKIFKEFPELKDVIFQNREYNKILW